MFATGDEGCPVTIFKDFLSPRPLEIRKTRSSQVWYERQPMGVSKLNDMMKAVIKGMTQADSWKTFSNHSPRTTVVRRLETAGLERRVKVTAHRKEKSLNDENEQRAFLHHQPRHNHQEPCRSLWSSIKLIVEICWVLTENQAVPTEEDKHEVMMAGYWPSSLFMCLRPKMEPRSMNTHKKERGYYSAVLTEQAWWKKVSLNGKKIAIFLRNIACNPERTR